MNEINLMDKQHVMRSWTTQKNTNPSIIDRGEGAYFFDNTGKPFLDFSSQRVNLNLGHQHPIMLAAMQKQLFKLTTCGQIFATDVRSEAAYAIADKAPSGLNKIFFTNAGSDAVEHATRMAREFTGRQKILTMHKSYHGATAAAMTLTGDQRRWYANPAQPGAVKFFGPFLFRSTFHAKSQEEECERALQHLREIIKYENPDLIAAIMVEPIIGSNGVIVPPDGYLQGVRELCDQHGIVMISDEVMTGFGRTGAWFAVDHWGVIPDLITFAKGVNSGYIPIGGVILSDRIAEYFDEHYLPSGGTYYGHPLACASVVASLNILREQSIPMRVKKLGESLLNDQLSTIVERHACIGEHRGKGFLWALELVEDSKTKKPMMEYTIDKSHGALVQEMTRLCKDNGLSTLISANCLFITPPLITEEVDLRKGLTIIDDVLTEIDNKL